MSFKSVLLAAIYFSCACIAHAAHLSYELFATVYNSDAPTELAIGDRIKFVFTIEDSIPDSITTADDPGGRSSLFSNAVTYISMELLPGSSGTYSKATASGGNIELSDMSWLPPFNESLVLNFDADYSYMDYGSINGDPFGFMWIQFFDLDMNVFTNNDLTLAEQLIRDITEFNLDVESFGPTIQLYTQDPNWWLVSGSIDSVSRIENFTPPARLFVSTSNVSTISLGAAYLLNNDYYSALCTTNLVGGIWSTVATFRAVSGTTNISIEAHQNMGFYRVQSHSP